MTLKFVVESIEEGYIVELWNHHGRKIYARKDFEVVGVRSCNCSSNFGNLLADDEWPWYIENHLGDELVELDSYSKDYAVEHFAMKL